MATVTIDFQSFPHIFEAIVSYAPVPSLIKLRATCRQIKDDIDAKLFDHIIISSSGGPTDNIQAWNAPHAQLPYCPDQTPLGPMPSPILRSRVIDYYGTSSTYPNLISARIIRRRTDMNLPKASRLHTLVDYVDLGRDTSPHLRVPYVRRWVVHVVFHSITQAVNSVCNLLLPVRPKNLVVVLKYTGKSAAQEDGLVEFVQQPSSRYSGLMGDLELVGILRAMKGTTITYVGVESLPPLALGMPAGTPPLQIVKRLRKQFRRKLQTIIPQGRSVGSISGNGTLRPTIDNIKFVTFEEWVASLSEHEQTISEMPTFVPDHWPGGPRG